MTLLKSKEFWINFVLLSLTLLLCNWLFSAGWQFIKRGISFQESIKNHEFNGDWIAIAVGISFARARKSENGYL